MPDYYVYGIFGIVVILLFVLILKTRAKITDQEDNTKKLASSQKQTEESLKSISKTVEKMKTRIEEAENALMQADIDLRKLDEAVEEHHKRAVHNINELYKQDREHEEKIDKIESTVIPTINDSIRHIDTTLDEISNTLLPTITKITSRHAISINEINSQIVSLNGKILDIEDSITQLQKSVKNFTDITVDSSKLNSPDVIPTNSNIDSPSAKDSGNVLNEEKRIIFEQLENTYDNYLITGKGGTGKTYLLKYFCQKTKKTIICMAPTGIAAVSIDGATIHSVFGFDNINDITGEHLTVSDGLRALLMNIDTIIIDEISMVRADAFTNINKLMQMANKNDKPFGGKQVILFGDLFQLPPVATDDGEKEAVQDIYGGLYFFFSSAYKAGNFHFCELQELFRFELITPGQRRFIEILDKAREGNVSAEDIQFLNQRYQKSEDLDRTVIRLHPVNAAVANVNKKRLLEIDAPEYVYSAEISPNVKNKKDLEDYFRCELELHLKIGAVVMMISNDTEYGRWVNGTRGIVSHLSKNSIKVTINEREYEIDKKTFTKKKCYYNSYTKKVSYETIASVTQYPIVLAYAITIHKSQGQTYPELACTINSTFAAGQAYVALSRCRNYEKLYLLRKIKPETFIVDPSVQKFYLEHKK